nr:zinc finger protein 808-like [Lytechinus pictus]
MSDASSDAEAQAEGLTDWQTKDRLVKEKVANMYRFTNNVDLRRMPQETFETAMASRATLALHAERRKSTNKVKRNFETNSVVSFHSDDKLIRVVLTENLPFMCTLCGETFVHTRPLQDHVEEKHSYFQENIDLQAPRKKPIIIAKNFGRKEKNALQDQLDDSDDENDDGDSVAPAVVSDAEPDRQGAEEEGIVPVAIGSVTDDGVELLLSEMASQEEVPTTVEEETAKGPFFNGTSPSKEIAPQKVPGVRKKSKKKKKKQRRDKYTVVNAEHIVKEREESERKKQKLDENGEPREVRKLRPFCVICHLHCESRVICRQHLAEAHNIFPSREAAEKAWKRMKERGEDPVVNGADECRDRFSNEQREQEDVSMDSLGNVEGEIIKCEFCESYVFDKITYEKHMRAHCGNPGIKCDICREGIRLWENLMLDELKDLGERMLSKDRRPQDVDCDTGKTAQRKYPNSRIVSTCYECNDQFYHSSHIGNHYAKAHSSITCKECQITLPNMQALAVHSLDKHRPGVFRCPWCPRRFHDRGKYNYHLAGHMGQYRCPGCGRNFVEKPSLNYHLKKYEKFPEHFQGRQKVVQEISFEKPFLSSGITDHQNRELVVMVCELCNATFLNKGGYTRHMNKVHPGHQGRPMEKSFICDICGNVFWSKTNLMMHKKIHDKKFPCTYPGCTKKFWARSMMKKHMETHEGAPTYFCEDCGRTYKHSGSLRLHRRTHTEGRGKCDKCGLEFKGRANLAKHMNDVHKQVLLFTCGVCDMQLGSRSQLLSHAKVHSEHLQGFVCETCTCVFPEERLLTQHMRVHNKTYQCNYCQDVLDSADALKRHHLQEHAFPAQQTPDSIQHFDADTTSIQIEVQDSGVVIMEYPSTDQEATDRAIAAIVSELQG